VPQVPQPPQVPQVPQPPQVPQVPQPPQVPQVPQPPQVPQVPAPVRGGRVARKEGEASGAGDTAPARLTGSAEIAKSTPVETQSATSTDTVIPVSTADVATLVPQWQALQPAQLATPVQARPTAHNEADAAVGALRPPARQPATVAGSNKLPDPEPPTAPSTLRTERAAESLPPAPIHGLPVGPADIALPAVALPTPPATPAAMPSGGAAAPVAEARMAAGPGSEAFAAELGSQLTTFVRDGVQHARLHLHPAELGPVTVQIQIDGQAAQIHMAAENGLTRQALEQSMPLLAGSLREAGLTLSGGGVFEQPRQQRDPAPQGTASGGRPGPESADEPALRPGLTAMRRRGVVDLVA